jgi:hypothetical protein
MTRRSADPANGRGTRRPSERRPRPRWAQRVGNNRFPTLCVAAQAATSRRRRACTIDFLTGSSMRGSVASIAGCHSRGRGALAPVLTGTPVVRGRGFRRESRGLGTESPVRRQAAERPVRRRRSKAGRVRTHPALLRKSAAETDQDSVQSLRSVGEGRAAMRALPLPGIRVPEVSRLRHRSMRLRD